MEQLFVIFAIIGGLVVVTLLWRERAMLSPGKTAPEKTFHRTKLVSVLLSLDDRSVNELLALYKNEFGAGPARYARKTYMKWRSGEVRPATQTFQRFLLHLPHVMSFDLKCEVLRLFMEEYAAKDNYKLAVTTDDWQKKLEPLVDQVIEKAYTAKLPVEIERKLRWLGEGDMQAAQEMLKHSQAAEGKIVISTLREEFANIEKLLEAEHLKPRVTHTLKFPYGTIDLTIKRR